MILISIRDTALTESRERVLPGTSDELEDGDGGEGGGLLGVVKAEERGHADHNGD